jgi:hypothetical protein
MALLLFPDQWRSVQHGALFRGYKACIYLVGEGGGEAKSEESYDHREIGR